MEHDLVDELNDGNLPIDFIESIIPVIAQSRLSEVPEISLVSWISGNMVEYTITDYDEALEFILDYLIRCEEYELCDKLIEVKNEVTV